MSRNASTDELYFATLTVIDWIDVFTRRQYSDFIIENLTYCQQHKGLNIYAYVIMTNHIHLVANVTDGSFGEVLGRFKSHTSKKLFEMIANNMQANHPPPVIARNEAISTRANPRTKISGLPISRMPDIHISYFEYCLL